MTKELKIPANGVTLRGDLHVPDDAKGLVIFSHGSGSSRRSPRNRFVAGTLEANGFATLLFDLLTEEEDLQYERRFDIGLLTRRLIAVTHWIHNQPDYPKWFIGYFGASTGAASALAAAASIGKDIVKAVVSRGGRPDLATTSLAKVKSPTLFIVGALDPEVIRLNEEAYKKMECIKEVKIIPGATHLFEESGKLEQVTRLASDWFIKHLYRQQVNIGKDYLG